jgi:translation initiation factor 2D
MFKRPLSHQSNATPIRSSSRRALVNDIFASYPSFHPQKPQHETPEQAGEREKAERDLGKMILPEGIRQASIETSGGVEGVSTVSPDTV